MKIAFIHSDKKISTGAHYINDLIADKLRKKGNLVSNFYPKTSLVEPPVRLKGLANILFFYSLLEYKNKVLKHDIVQGTTYTPLPFLAFDIPVVTHFGSTTQGFLKNTPLARHMSPNEAKIWYELRSKGVIDSVNIKTRKPMRDIAEIEHYVAEKANAVIATSEIVKNNLIDEGIDPHKIFVIHNAVEDYWFETEQEAFREKPALLFLGRIGGDPFSLKLKGFDRLLYLYRQFNDIDKVTVCMTPNKKIVQWMLTEIPNHRLFPNIKKDTIPGLIKNYCGGILLLTSRYEGFSLSLIEGMTQGLVPVCYRVGVVPEIIKDGHNGFIVSSETEAKNRIQELIDNTELRKTMSRNARKTSLAFTASTMTQELTEVYKHVLENRPITTSNKEVEKVNA